MKTFLWLLGRLGKWLIKKSEDNVWQCFFCKKLFNTDKPRVNAYVESQAIYQCDSCRIKDLEHTPTPVTIP